MKKQITNLEKTTVAFGYGLFALFFTSVILTTIFPMVSTFFSPSVRHFNVIVFMISITAGAILPTLLSYFIGDWATHAKNRLIHHFNGVLFGITAFWISLLINYFGVDTVTWLRSIFPDSLALVVNSSWQIAIPVLIMAIVAVAYSRQQKIRSTVLEYKPYQAILFGSIIISAIGILANALDPDAFFITVLLAIGIPLLLIILSYVALLKLPLSKLTRLTLSVVSMSFALIATYIESTLFSYMTTHNNFLLLTLITGVVVMLTYLVLIRRRV